MRSSTPADRLAAAAALLVWLSLAFLPVNIEVVLLRPPGPDDALHRVSLTPEDPLLLGLAVLVAGWLLTSHRPWLRHPVFLGFAAVIVTTGLALVATPSWRGVQALLRLIECGALVGGLVWVLGGRWRATTLRLIAASAIAQTMLAGAQVARGSTLGLSVIGEYPPLLPFGEALAAKGSFTHPYLLAGFSMVAASTLALTTRSHVRRARTGWAVLALLAAVPLGLTYSRMSPLGLVLVVLVLLGPFRPRRRRVLAPVVPLALGALIPAIAVRGGWISRAIQAEQGTTVDMVASGRLTFVRQAADMLHENLWFGVGPGQYMTALDRYYDPPAFVEWPVHNVPMLLATEGGVLVGIAVVLFGLWTASWVLRSGRRTTALFVAYLPFLLLDHPISHPQGLCTIGMWLGVVLATGRQEREAPDSPPYLPAAINATTPS